MMDDDEGGPDVSLKSLTNPQNNPGVHAFVVMNEAGIAVKASNNLSTKIQGQQPVPNDRAAHYAANVALLLSKVKAGLKKEGEEEEQDALESIRLRTSTNEIIVVPAEKYTIIVIHEPFKKKEDKKEEKKEGEEEKEEE
mmetsp:Transcript_13082/g.20974  ORF Transcript_13082/g.20974 Transcript_13082/m.20974 type:complete len:139 (-) Transcript_13082:215-631(-)|eukprot:jgi/Bigna1/85772/estExt_fgenesh1_pg.C_60069